MSRKMILYIAMILDKKKKKKDDNLDFLSLVEKPNEDYGYAEFTNTIDTVIWGRKTFDKVKSFGLDIPHADKKVYVISKSKQGIDGHVEYSNDVVDLVKKLKSEEGKDIYCDGGAEIVTLLLNSELFDRIIISVIPHILGDGIRLFKENNLAQKLSLKKSVSYPSGLVQLCYDVLE